MSGILGLMDIAKRALAAQQLGVEVTSHNISNVNTPGFSRQIVRTGLQFFPDRQAGPKYRVSGGEQDDKVEPGSGGQSLQRDPGGRHERASFRILGRLAGPGR
ncbi:MAG: hypothetical protein HY743_07560 [Deltaproteobacteria bacterium]|nr:hypothetical protein [Deltaproteobacteria bacterium]